MKYVGPFTILQIDEIHTYLVEQNGRVSRESESWLKTCYPSASGTGKGLRIGEPDHQPTRQGMVVRKKPRAAKTANLHDWMEERVGLQRERKL